MRQDVLTSCLIFLLNPGALHPKIEIPANCGGDSNPNK